MSERTGEILLDFVRRNLLSEPRRVVTLDTLLLTDGLIDSMGLTLLGAFIEERFNIRFDDTEMRAGALEALRDVAAVIEERCG